jgi:hypothetical protein
VIEHAFHSACQAFETASQSDCVKLFPFGKGLAVACLMELAMMAAA